MNTMVSICDPGRLEQLVPMWDEEFVFAKGRQHSLLERLPHLFGPEAAATAHVASIDGRIAATAVARPFRWLTPEKVWRGAMVGLVYSRPEFRGRGLASSVLRSVQAQLRQARTEFAVLWTTIPRFYERLGWVSLDRGLFCQVRGRVRSTSMANVTVQLVASADMELLEAVRARWQPQRLERSRMAYRAVPLPATAVEAYLHHDDGGQEAYALVGRAGETGYVYEMVGPTAAFPHLWNAIHRNFDTINVNGTRGTASSWLQTAIAANWQQQQLTMWLPLSSEPTAPLDEWYIPFFDRI